MMGDAVFVPVNPPGEEVAVKLVMAAPPFELGAVNVIDACALPRVAVPIVGAPGIVGPSEGSVTLIMKIALVVFPGSALPSSKK